MSECQPLSSGQVLAMNNALTPCVNIKREHHKYKMRVVAKTNVRNGDCELMLNGEPAPVVNAYPSSKTNEQVFVSHSGDDKYKVAVRCDDREAEIVSVGLFDESLSYGTKFSNVIIPPHGAKNILFTAMSEMNQDKIEDMPDMFAEANDLNDFESMFDSLNSLLDGVIFDEEASSNAPDLSLTMDYNHGSGDKEHVHAKIIPLNGDNKYVEYPMGLIMKMSSNQDYVLRIENRGKHQAAMDVESQYVGLMDDIDLIVSKDLNMLKRMIQDLNRVYYRSEPEYEKRMETISAVVTEQDFASDVAYYTSIGSSVIAFGLIGPLIIGWIFSFVYEHCINVRLNSSGNVNQNQEEEVAQIKIAGLESSHFDYRRLEDNVVV